jgi:hypothetical protein
LGARCDVAARLDPDDGCDREHFEAEVGQVATVRQLTASEYQVTITGTELALVRNALHEAERFSSFGVRLWREIESLATRVASLRSLQRMMAEVDRRGESLLRRLGWVP